MSEASAASASLRRFRDDGLISDECEVIKSGKEATVYCCKACASAGGGLLAAKVYRPRQFRSFKHDAVYQAGRVILDARLRRTVAKKTRRGRGVQSGMWVAGEFETLQVLHEAGADVPRPLASSGSAILMEYVGARGSPAPTLNQVALDRQEARRLFDRVVENVELFLTCNRVHADLSAFNILYWRGRIKIIDFPQAVDPRVNPDALSLLLRDLGNVHRYFARHGVQAAPARVAGDLWRRYLRAEL